MEYSKYKRRIKFKARILARIAVISEKTHQELWFFNVVRKGIMLAWFLMAVKNLYDCF
jgi:hypothetical protein